MDTVAAKKSNKHWVAFSSLLCAFALTGMKIVVGLATGSLGILAEAAHSGLDLLAAAMTCFAIRWASQPADREHPFGHGKIESLSAFLEALLLLLTCIWIVYHAVRRLFFHETIEVETTIWSFAVVVVSIIIDYSRSRALARAAKEHNSQALEADALHFQTDIWSSLAVLVGLAFVAIGNRFPTLAILKNADAIAALAVAGIAGGVTWKLTLRTVNALIDRAPSDLDDRVRQLVETLPGIADCHRVRVRISGSETFVDLHITVTGNPTLEEAHALTETVEAAVRTLVPEADVLVHPEPPDVSHG